MLYSIIIEYLELFNILYDEYKENYKNSNDLLVNELNHADFFWGSRKELTKLIWTGDFILTLVYLNNTTITSLILPLFSNMAANWNIFRTETTIFMSFQILNNILECLLYWCFFFIYQPVFQKLRSKPWGLVAPPSSFSTDEMCFVRG